METITSEVEGKAESCGKTSTSPKPAEKVGKGEPEAQLFAFGMFLDFCVWDVGCFSSGGFFGDCVPAVGCWLLGAP